MPAALIDAGPMVSLFDSASPAHGHYHRLLAESPLALSLHSTWPCVIEAAHFLSPPRRWALLDWVARGAVSIFPFDARDLLEMLPIMQRYTEPPRTDVDFADATLLWLAAQTGVTRIMTIDVRDFRRYRLPDGRGFELL